MDLVAPAVPSGGCPPRRARALDSTGCAQRNHLDLELQGGGSVLHSNKGHLVICNGSPGSPEHPFTNLQRGPRGPGIPLAARARPNQSHAIRQDKKTFLSADRSDGQDAQGWNATDRTDDGPAKFSREGPGGRAPSLAKDAMPLIRPSLPTIPPGIPAKLIPGR